MWIEKLTFVSYVNRPNMAFMPPKARDLTDIPGCLEMHAVAYPAF